MHSNFDITHARWGEVKRIDNYDMAILPWGATEPHNFHLPYCTDMLITQAIAFEVAQNASENSVNVMVLPGIPLGAQNPGQIELKFCIHTSMQTQMAILKDIVTSLKRQNINKLMILNGHGGNTFKGMIRDIMIEDSSFTICQCDWFSVVNPAGYFEEKVDDHAGESETSVMLHYYPESVDMSLAGDGSAKKFAIEELNSKVAWTPRNWSEVTKDTGIGNPEKATAEKGKKYIAAVVPKISALVINLVKNGIY